MRVLDLFSGIGGFSLGLERAGFETVAFCEIDPFCRKVLAKHWPDVPCYEDVNDVDPKTISARYVCGGFPCQPYSRANRKRKGTADKRDLSRKMLEIVEGIKPAAVIGENTEGFIDIGLASYCDAMEEIGYYTTTLSVPACGYGLPTLERHCWLISTPDSEQCERIAQVTIQGIERVAEQLPRSDTRIPKRWDSAESRVCRVGQRDPQIAHRIKALGNAVDPIMPEIIGRAIKEVEDARNDWN